MLPPEDLSRLRDMLDYSRRVEQHVAGATRGDFDADEQLQTTVVHYLQIIGEAATKVSPAFRTDHPEIPWNAVTAMRHRIVHDYRKINLARVWQTATERIPHLITTLSNLLP